MLLQQRLLPFLWTLHCVANVAQAWILTVPNAAVRQAKPLWSAASSTEQDDTTNKRRQVVVIGAGWGGLSAAHTLSKNDKNINVTVLEASPRVGGLVRDGFTTLSGQRPAEAGQHGFWKNYHNIFRLLRQEINDFDISQALTDYAEQGQYSPRGLEAIWPVYRNQPSLPTGLAQAVHTKFVTLPLQDRVSAFPLILAFAEFDDSEQAWQKYDQVSFRDLCRQLGVSRRMYYEAFESMILTGLFAPGRECSAAAALGMAYFFVMQSQTAFGEYWVQPCCVCLLDCNLVVLCNSFCGFVYRRAMVPRQYWGNHLSSLGQYHGRSWSELCLFHPRYRF